MRIGGLAFALGLAACGGSVGGTTFQPISDAGASSSSSSSSSGGGSSGGLECAVTKIPADRACVPATAAPKTPITIEVEQADTAESCPNRDQLDCVPTITGNVISLAVQLTECVHPVKDLCTFTPAVPMRTTCTLPALAEGKFTIVIAGEPSRSGLPDRELVVAAGGASSCKLPPPGGVPQTTVGSYTQDCQSDADCVAVITGDICEPCKCPDQAIAKSAESQYDADYRVAAGNCSASQAGGGGAVCGACFAPTVTCAHGVRNSCALVH